MRDTAIQAFTQLQPAWRLSKRYGRPILRYAALLHEIGLCIEYKKAPQHAAYIIDNIDMPGFTPAQKKLLSALLLNQRDDFKAGAAGEAGRRDGSPGDPAGPHPAHLPDPLHAPHQGTVPQFMLQADEDALTLTLPRGWLDEHYLRASELRLEVERQQKMGWSTRLLEA